jgi:hypothetical protein
MSSPTILPKIFISYAEENIEDAEKLKSLLDAEASKAGDAVPEDWIYLARRSNEGGDDWRNMAGFRSLIPRQDDKMTRTADRTSRVSLALSGHAPSSCVPPVAGGAGSDLRLDNRGTGSFDLDDLLAPHAPHRKIPVDP